MTVSPKKVVLKGDPVYKNAPLQALDEYDVGAIMPGMLIQRTAAGEVEPHDTATGFASPMFAVELPAREGQDIDTAYDQDGESVLYAYCRPGDEVYALLEVGANVAEAALLESNGAGYLQAGTTNPVVRAIEAVNNSAGDAAVRIRVEVL